VAEKYGCLATCDLARQIVRSHDAAIDTAAYVIRRHSLRDAGGYSRAEIQTRPSYQAYLI